MKHLILLIFVALTVNSCNTDDDSTPTDPFDKLPPKTQTGENTFGYLVNGKPINVTNTSQQVAIFQEGQLQFGVTSGNKNIEYSIAMNIIDDLKKNNKYNLGQNSFKAGFTSKNENQICIYKFENTFNGYVRFSEINREKFIISGTFEFSTVKEKCDTVHITNGRFDMQYIP